MGEELQVADLEKRKRLMKLINFYNKSFQESDLDNLIRQGSFDYFYLAVNRMPENKIEEMDAEVVNKLVSELRN